MNRISNLYHNFRANQSNLLSASSSSALKIGKSDIAKNIISVKNTRDNNKIDELNRKSLYFASNGHQSKAKSSNDSIERLNIKIRTRNDRLLSMDVKLEPTTAFPYDYSSIGSNPINTFLRNDDDSELKKHFSVEPTTMLNLTISALEEGRIKGSPQSFFRLASDDNLVLTKSKIGDVFSDRGLTSAGTNLPKMLESDLYQEVTGDRVAKPMVVTIKGNPAIVAKGGALEAIFPPNSKLKVEQKSWKKDSNTNGDVLYISLVEEADYKGKVQDIYSGEERIEADPDDWTLSKINSR